MRSPVATLGQVTGFELKRLFVNPAVWGLLAALTVAQQGLAFFVAGFFPRGVASMAASSDMLPLSMVLLCGALAMLLWTRPRRNSGEDVMLSLPQTPWAQDLGRFMAGYIVLLVWLVLVYAPLAVSIAWLGSPDWAAEAVRPLAGAVLAFLLFGMASLGAAMCRHMVSGFALAALLAGLPLAAGWGIISALLPGILPMGAQAALLDHSLLAAYHRMVEGLFALSDLAWFVALPAVCLALTGLLRRWSRRERVRGAMGQLVVAAVLVVLAIGAQFSPAAADLSSGGLFTPSKGAMQVVHELKHTEPVTFYFSDMGTDVPPPERARAWAVRGYLKRLVAASGDKLVLQYANPFTSHQAEFAALKAGLKPKPLPSGQRFYLGITVGGGTDAHAAGPFIDATAQATLERDLLIALRRNDGYQAADVGIFSGLNIDDQTQRPALVGQMAADYHLINLKADLAVISPSVKLVVVWYDPYLSENALYALTQYVMRGGHVLVLQDPVLRSAPDDSLRAPGSDDGLGQSASMANLLSAWGVGYTPNEVVYDPTLATPVRQNQLGTGLNPLWLSLTRNNINQDLPYAHNINRLLLADAGHFSMLPTAPKSLRRDVIMISSKWAQWIPRSTLRAVDDNVIKTDAQGLPGIKVLGVQLSGLFPPVFDAQPDSVVTWYKNHKGTWPKDKLLPDIRGAAKPGQVIVLGDADFLSDGLNNNGSQADRPVNQNGLFLQRIAAYMVGDKAMLSVPVRLAAPRPMTRLNTLLQKRMAAQAKREEQLLGQLQTVRKKIEVVKNQLKNSPVDESVFVNQVQALQFQDLSLIRDIDSGRHQLELYTQRVDEMVALLNVLVWPVLVLLVALEALARRRRRSRAQAA